MFTIPNIITLLNLLCGSLAVIQIITGNPDYALILTLFAAIFDFLDGFAARITHQVSNIGKELDSLSDVVSFGLVPALAMFYMYHEILVNQASKLLILSFLPLFIVLFSALRLARFNVMKLESKNFSGLPTPANTLLLLPVYWGYLSGVNWINSLFSNLYMIPILVIISCCLLISDFPMLSLKGKSKYSEWLPLIIISILSLPVFYLLGISGLFICMLLYIIVSFITLNSFFRRSDLKS